MLLSMLALARRPVLSRRGRLLGTGIPVPASFSVRRRTRGVVTLLASLLLPVSLPRRDMEKDCE
jgi:hypothetical protein